MNCLFSTKKWAAVFVAVLAFFSGSAAAEDLSILCTLPLESLGNGMVNVYKAQTSQDVKITISTGAIVRDRIRKGEKFDIVITTRDVIEGWAASGQLAKGNATGIGKIGYGLRIRKGYPKLDISTVDGFKNALRGAKSIGGSEGSVALGYLETLLRDLGLAEELKSRTKVFARGTFPKWLINGEADMVVSFISEFIYLKDNVDYAGPLPKELQSYVEFHAGIGAESTKKEQAIKFLQFANSPSVDSLFMSTGVDRIR